MRMPRTLPSVTGRLKAISVPGPQARSIGLHLRLLRHPQQFALRDVQLVEHRAQGLPGLERHRSASGRRWHHRSACSCGRQQERGALDSPGD